MQSLRKSRHGKPEFMLVRNRAYFRPERWAEKGLLTGIVEDVLVAYSTLSGDSYEICFSSFYHGCRFAGLF